MGVALRRGIDQGRTMMAGQYFSTPGRRKMVEVNQQSLHEHGRGALPAIYLTKISAPNV